MIDWERKVRDLIRKGSVFYFPESTFSKTCPHYFVVLNNNPTVDSEIFMVSAKSFNDKDIRRFERNNFPRETFVDIPKGGCNLFDRLTLFDCNSIICKKITVLASKMENGGLQDKGYIEKEILERICAGVIFSPTVEEEIKDMIR